MELHSGLEVEFVAPEAEIVLEGNCVHDSTGTFKVLTLPDELLGSLGGDDELSIQNPPINRFVERRRFPR